MKKLALLGFGCLMLVIAVGCGDEIPINGCGGNCGGGGSTTTTFVATADPNGNGMHVLSASSSGALTEVALSPFSSPGQPQAVAVHPTAKYLYVANFQLGTVSAYAISSAGGLTALVPASVGAGTNPAFLAVDPSGKFLIVTNRTDIRMFSIDVSTGALSNAPVATGTLGNTNPIPSQLAIDPLGKYVFVGTDQGTIFVFALDATAQTLTSVGSPVTAGTPMEALLVDPTGNFLYAPFQNAGDSQILEFQITRATGALTPLAGSPVHLGSLSPTGMVIAPAGTLAYVAFGSQLSIFSLNATTGELAAVGSPFNATTGAGSLAIDASGKFLYSADQATGKISVFSIGTGGALTAVTNSPFTAGSSASGIVTFVK